MVHLPVGTLPSQKWWHSSTVAMTQLPRYDGWKSKVYIRSIQTFHNDPSSVKG